MKKIWSGRLGNSLSSEADAFNSSIAFDSRLYKQDILGSIAHATMLAKQGILTKEDADLIVKGLQDILEDIETGALPIDLEAEDIHSFIESELTSRIGDAGKRLHTARSRNDQTAVDLRMYLRDQGTIIKGLLVDLVKVLADKASDHRDTIMPGYTHLQRAQPVTYGHHLMAYAMMFLRDIGRIKDALARMNYSPLGSCALAGTSYNIDRAYTAQLLGFDGITQNSMDSVSDRDFCIELLAASSIIMMHMSRFCEELILWSSWEFGFVEMDDSCSTGSSIMPQKKNPDIAELIRGKVGRVYGHLVSTLTMMKGLPLSYNKDMQEDKEAIFDCMDTVKACLGVFTPMIKTLTVNKDRMYKATQEGFINATDLADYLVNKGMPFRTAYKIIGQIVAYCIEKGLILEKMPIEDYKGFSQLFDTDLYEQISPEACIKRRISEGGTGSESLEKQLAYVSAILDKEKEK